MKCHKVIWSQTFHGVIFLWRTWTLQRIIINKWTDVGILAHSKVNSWLFHHISEIDYKWISCEFIFVRRTVFPLKRMLRPQTSLADFRAVCETRPLAFCICLFLFTTFKWSMFRKSGRWFACHVPPGGHLPDPLPDQRLQVPARGQLPEQLTVAAGEQPVRVPGGPAPTRQLPVRQRITSNQWDKE